MPGAEEGRLRVEAKSSGERSLPALDDGASADKVDEVLVVHFG